MCWQCAKRVRALASLAESVLGSPWFDPHCETQVGSKRDSSSRTSISVALKSAERVDCSTCRHFPA